MRLVGSGQVVALGAGKAVRVGGWGGKGSAGSGERGGRGCGGEARKGGIFGGVNVPLRFVVCFVFQFPGRGGGGPFGVAVGLAGKFFSPWRFFRLQSALR